ITVPAVSDDEQLSQELASLHIQRETPRTSGRGWGRIIVVILLLGGAGAGGYFVLHRTENQLFAEEAEMGAVTLVSASQQDVTLVATGYVYSRRKATIAPKVNGRIAKLYVDEGDPVKEGQLIAELDV